MKRMKKHKVKKEKPETSTSQTREKEDHDLAFYIHDRVELMHQVFSVLKYKELTAFAPECIRHISNNDLQELCTEELLGISSKRLCATLDGAAPPSDTESSSQSSPELETISLDSISSDEGLLSPVSGKKKKHKHRTKGKSKRKSRSSDGGEGGVEGQGSGEATRASRAGLTVLELLELQARARAIRAQLHQEQAAKHISETQPAEPSTHSDEHHSDVEIKEEPAEVVEISSEDEKPDIKELEKATEKPSSSQPSPEGPEKPEPVIKRVNDLIISVPQTKPTRKIKLNRHKVVISVPNVEKTNENVASPVRSVVIVDEKVPEVAKTKKKQKKKGKSKSDAKDGSDHDEITLQLSDTEKMDLLEDLDRKVYDSVSSSEDSESSSSDDDDTEKERQKQKLKEKEKEKKALKEKVHEVNECEKEKCKDEDQVEKVKEVQIEMEIATDIDTVKDKSPEKGDAPEQNTDITVLERESKVTETEIPSTETVNENIPIINAKEDIENRDKMDESREPNEVKNTEQTDCEAMATIDTGISEITEASVEKEMSMEISTIEEIPIIDDISTAEPSKKDNGATEKEETDIGVSEIAITEAEKDMERSEGEVSDKDSSEVEAVDLKPEVVCISDEESGKKKKKKKEKKKKEKKSKKTKSDFREGDDENFYRDTDECSIDDDVYEILELSDDSSCYEVEGTVLSKEPTAEEIAALSAKIDEIDREEVVTEEQIKHYENSASDQMETENISWKDRYLDSRKVKRVLSTANILNALRKKNKELKKKIEKSKEEVPVVIEAVVEKVTESLEEGSIEQYNTLQGSTKYVDPIAEVVEGEGNLESSMEEKEGPITKAMKKDAKQLLKMYKTLLKYNNINKEKDPNKKKKKKQKKKDKNKDGVNSSVVIAEVKNGV